MPDEQIQGPFDLVVVLDGDRTRLEPPVERAFQGAKARGLIDHHRSTEREGYDLILLDPEACSTAEMVEALIGAWGLPLDRELATCLYVGLIFDTGGFRHANTRPSTHLLAARLLAQGLDSAEIHSRVLVDRSEAALQLLAHAIQGARLLLAGRARFSQLSLATGQACGAVQGDLEGIVEALLHSPGVEVSCLVVERYDGRTKLSLRSRTAFDVAAFARRVCPTGGGHARAAGAVIPEPFEAVVARLPALLVAALEEGS